MRAATVRAQAKINLYLRVTGRESTGYHHLETLFCRIDLADGITVRLTPAARTLDCAGPALPRGGLGPVAENLAWRAALAYSGVARWPAGFEIEIEKQIPVGAGLGGGSADAGGVLRVLNALNPRPIAEETLLGLARELGADVPFLTHGSTTLAHAWRRGDLWQEFPPLPERTCLLVVPPVAVTTRDAYAWLDEARRWTTETVSLEPISRPFREPRSWDDVRSKAHNDFEAVIFPRHQVIEETCRILEEVARRYEGGFARMSGSGSAVFAILPVPTPPADLSSAVPTGARTLVTRTSTRVEAVQPID